ncbi:MAG TPA: hemolysin family protein [Gemmatimonadaceae bacterium]|nr:hemolysin family protein [Gemmatimonadaceae bacterium]
MIIRLVAIVALVLLNAFFVGAEFALVRSRRPRLEALAREGDRPAARVLRALPRIARLLAAAELGITLASLALGWLLAGWFLPHTATWGTVVGLVIAIIIVAYLHIVFGELAPRTAAITEPERLARLLTPPLLVFAWLTWPITAIIARSSHLATRRLRENGPARASSAHSPDELRILVERSEEVGALEPQDADLLEGVFEFSEKNAREVMTPRTEIVALPLDATLDETLAIVEESKLSRFPVYAGSIDNIVGILLAKDLLPLLTHPPASFTLRAVMRPAHVIPGTREVEEVLADFKRLKEHMAVVLDEYGGTAGVVTMEDLLEEIVGEILDEYDEAEQPPERSRSGAIIIPGDTNIGEMNEEHGLSVPEHDYTTIGGFVFGTLGRLPRPGDSVSAGGASFTVHRMAGRRIDELAMVLMPMGTAREEKNGKEL